MGIKTGPVVANQTDPLRIIVPGIVVGLCEFRVRDKPRCIIDAKPDPSVISTVPYKLRPNKRTGYEVKRGVRVEKQSVTIRERK